VQIFADLDSRFVCDTCHHTIDEDIHRIMIFSNQEKVPVVKRFHFFFPCWDFNYICKRYPGLQIRRAGFSCSQTNRIYENDLGKNQNYWV